jgi:hypothetical protein
MSAVQRVMTTRRNSTACDRIAAPDVRPGILPTVTTATGVQADSRPLRRWPLAVAAFGVLPAGLLSATVDLEVASSDDDAVGSRADTASVDLDRPLSNACLPLNSRGVVVKPAKGTCPGDVVDVYWGDAGNEIESP